MYSVPRDSKYYDFREWHVQIAIQIKNQAPAVLRGKTRSVKVFSPKVPYATRINLGFKVISLKPFYHDFIYET